jgi:hypothetical protein
VLALAVGFASALVIAGDIVLLGSRQHTAIMNLQLGELAPLRDAIKSDTLSVLSFEAGLFGWMALART